MPNRVATYRPTSLPQSNRHQAYDQLGRNKRAKAFYNSISWRKLRSELATDPLCEECLKEGKLVPATIADHKEELLKRPDLGLSYENLSSKCWPCHSRRHAAARVGRQEATSVCK